MVDVSLEALSERKEILRLGRELDLPPLSLTGRLRLHHLLGRKVNTKTRRKSRFLETAKMESLEAEVLELTGEKSA